VLRNFQEEKDSMSGFTTRPQTRFGLHLYAAGGNPDAARRAGIRVDRLKMVTFMLAALGGILAASRVPGVSSSPGRGRMLLAAPVGAILTSGSVCARGGM
jgi:D-xylose transport system permease protein